MPRKPQRSLAEAGAKVYCTGRSLRGNPSPHNRPIAGEKPNRELIEHLGVRRNGTYNDGTAKTSSTSN